MVNGVSLFLLPMGFLLQMILVLVGFLHVLFLDFLVEFIEITS